jgi:hypothetical protein
MKKMMIALVAMSMSLAVSAQSAESFDRIADYLKLGPNQRGAARLAALQFEASMKTVDWSNVKQAQLTADAIIARNKAKMAKILTAKQAAKYNEILDLTNKNAAIMAAGE